MEIGVGLPSGVPGARPELLAKWAAGADQMPFASLGAVDRVVYDNYDPLVALSVAAAVTKRIRLVTSILIAPLRETSTLAKQLKSLNTLSNSRLTVGMAIGARGDDYAVSEMAQAGRGDRLTQQLTALRDAWESDTVGPHAAAARPQVLVGGTSGPALARMARQADGYIHGGGPPQAFAKAAQQALAAWDDLGRAGRPELWSMAYYALGEGAQAGREYLLDYYAFTGGFASRIADGLLTTPLQIRDFAAGYAEAGCQHLVLFPAVAEYEQLELLAQAVENV